MAIGKFYLTGAATTNLYETLSADAPLLSKEDKERIGYTPLEGTPNTIMICGEVRRPLIPSIDQSVVRESSPLAMC